MRMIRLHRLCRIVLAAAAALLTAQCSAPPGDYVREDIRIPFAGAGPAGLEAMLIRPAAPGRYPLALISHGSPRNAAERAEMTPYYFYTQAVEFARHGFAALVVMRRGFGNSAGDFAESYGSCASPDYYLATRIATADLRAAIDAMAARGDVTTEGMIAVGISVGGLATVGLTAFPPQGLVAAINFAGGNGSYAANKVCNEDELIDAFGRFGKTSRTPMLWIYAQNDLYFGPDLARRFQSAFASGGGNAEFIAAPAFGDDGHNLFARGLDLWKPAVDRFLRDRNAGRRDLLGEPKLAAIPAPPQLSRSGRDDFTAYLKNGPHKAFAVSPLGAYSWRSGRRSTGEARQAALDACKTYAADCVLYATDDDLAAVAH